MSLSFSPCCGLFGSADRAAGQGDNESTGTIEDATAARTGTKGSSSSGFPAVSVHCLSTTFLEEVREHGLDESANLYDIENLSGDALGVIRRKGAHVTCPVDGRKGCSYVRCLEGDDYVGDANYMLSYTWGYTIGSIVEALLDFCDRTQQSPKRVYVWMCCLCVNQHRVVELRDQKKVVPFEEFSDTFYQRVSGIRNILSMMTSWNDPGYLKRAWCIYEMYVATTSPECTVTILMPPGEKHSFAREIEHGKGGNVFFQVLSKTDIEKAEAFPADKALIMEAVTGGTGEESGPGAHALNVVINDLLIEWSKNAILDVILVREKVCVDSGTDPSSDVAFARFLSLVGLLFWKQGFYDQALEQQGRALDIQKKVLGEADARTAQTYNDIGMTYNSLSRQREAMEHCKKSLEIRREVLGEVHKHTAESYSTVAMRLKLLGELDEALEMVVKALETRRKLYEVEFKHHADICRSLITVGRILAARDEHEAALEYFHQAVAEAKAKEVDDARLEARALDDMGASYNEMGDEDEAMATYEKCLRIREKILGSNHKLTTKIRKRMDAI